MTAAAASTPPLRQRAIAEMRKLLVVTVYLYVCFGAIILYKTAVLEGAGVTFAPWGIAIVKAVILAKFMLIGHALHTERRFAGRPLVWPTLYQSVIFLVMLLILDAIEECVVGLIHGRALAASLDAIGGGTLPQLLASLLIMFLILLPYFAFRALGEALGEDRLLRMFFGERARPA